MAREVFVLEYRTPKQDDWQVSTAFESKRVAEAHCADQLECAAHDEFGFDYRVSRYVPASPGI
jgi:hypothetical protein